MTSTDKSNITIDTTNIADGQTIDATDITVPFSTVEDQLQEGWIRVSENDTNVKHLEDALVTPVDSGLIVCAVDDGQDETFKIEVDQNIVVTTQNEVVLLNKTLIEPDIQNFVNAQHDHTSISGGGKLTAAAINSGEATNGYALTANGDGTVSWQEVTSDATQSIDLMVTAGEDLNNRDMVYLDEDTGTWFKIDINDNLNLKVGSLRGCVNETNGILENLLGTVRVFGEVSGFTGLTPWQTIYAHNIPGSYTQSKPAVAAGDDQVAVAELGYAASDSIVFMDQKPVYYAKRAVLANDESITIQHHSDASTQTRDLSAYIATTIEGSAVAEYADSNYNLQKPLKNESINPATFDNIYSGTNFPIGATNNNIYERAQSFTLGYSGFINSIEYIINSKGGDNINFYVQIRKNKYDENGISQPGSVLASTLHTFGSQNVGEWNTINFSPIYVSAGKTYWVYWYHLASPGENRYINIDGQQTLNEYPYSSFLLINGASSLNVTQNTRTYSLKVNFSSVTDPIEKLAQAFAIAQNTNVGRIKLYLRKINSPTGQLTVGIYPDDGNGNPSNILVDNNASFEMSEEELPSEFDFVSFDFDPYITLQADTKYWIVISSTSPNSASDYIEWGTDISPEYSGPEGTPVFNLEMRSYKDRGSGFEWGETSPASDGIFSVHEVDTKYNDPCVIGRWSGGARDIAARFDDGDSGNPDTSTTFKNVTGNSLDIICKVEVN